MTPLLAVARADATVEVWETRHSPVLRTRIGANHAYCSSDRMLNIVSDFFLLSLLCQAQPLASKPVWSVWVGVLEGFTAVDCMARLERLG